MNRFSTFYLLQFLQSHNDVFILVSNGTRVALKANPPTPGTEPSSPTDQTMSPDPSPAPDTGTTDAQQEVDQEPSLRQRYCWGKGTYFSISRRFKGKPIQPELRHQIHSILHFLISIPGRHLGVIVYLDYCLSCLSWFIVLSVSRLATGLTWMIPQWPPSGSLTLRSSSRAKRAPTCCSTGKHSYTGPVKVIDVCLIWIRKDVCADQRIDRTKKRGRTI